MMRVVSVGPWWSDQPMLALAALIVAVSMPAARVDGIGPRVADQRTPFSGAAPTSVVVKGGLRVTVSEGAPQVTVTAEKNLQSMVTIVVVGGALTITTVGEPVSDGGVVVAVHLPSLSTVKLQGAVRFSGSLQGDAVVESSGASELTLKGTPKSLALTAKGATKVQAAALKTDTVTLVVSGAASVDLGPCDLLVVSGSGVGRVRYRGDPKVTSKASGTVKVSKAGA